jgi:BMFP domain-containing protein YqiC
MITSNALSKEGMSPHLQDWKTRVVTIKSRQLLMQLKERQIQLESDSVHERMDQRLKDMSQHERDEVARRVASVLYQHKVDVNSSLVHATLESLRRKFETEYEGVDHNLNLGMASDGVVLKEAIYWLEVMWTRYHEDVEDSAYEAIQRDRRFLGKRWFDTLTFSGALRHPLFVNHVPLARRQHNTEYRLWGRVNEFLVLNNDSLHKSKHTSAASKSRYKALEHDLSLFGWMNRPGHLDGAMQITQARLDATTRTLNGTQRQHKEVIHWLKTIAIPRVNSVLSSTRAPAEAQLDSTLSTTLPRQQQLRAQVVTRVKDVVMQTTRSMDRFSKDEFMDHASALLRARQHQNNLDDAITQYLRQYREYHLDHYKDDMARRVRLVHDSCLDLTEDLLHRRQRVYHTARITDTLQHFQQQLVDNPPEDNDRGEREPEDDDEERNETRWQEVQESLSTMKDQIEAQLSSQDEDASVQLYLSKLQNKLESSTESLLRLSQTQWKQDTQALSATFLSSLPSLKNDRNLTAFWDREQTTATAVHETNHQGMQGEWTRQLQPFMQPIAKITLALNDALATHQKRVVDCVTECMETFIKRGTTGDVPTEWFTLWVKEPALAPKLEHLMEDLRQREEQLRLDNQTELLILTRTQSSILKTATSKTDSPTIPYTDVDAFFIATHCALLTTGL